MRTASSLGMAGLVTLAAAAWLLPEPSTQAAKPAAAGKANTGVAGKVTFLKGAASHSAKEAGPFKPVKRNEEVKEGEFLKTGGDGRLEVKLGDGSLVRLSANSLLRLGQAKGGDSAAPEKMQSKLTAGKMWATVTKAVGTETKFSVRTENAVAGVRGTIFRVNAEEDGATVVKVYEGAVAVGNGPLVEKSKSAGGKGPIDFSGRKQVAAPMHEVTLQEWEKMVSAGMSIKVAVSGEAVEPEPFTAANDTKDAADADWVAWNQEMDKASGREVPQ